MPSVLVVEDQDKLRANLIDMLSEDGNRAAGVRSGKEAIKSIAELRAYTPAPAGFQVTMRRVSFP